MNTDLGTKKWHPIHIHTQNELCSEINYKAYQRASITICSLSDQKPPLPLQKEV